MSQYFTLLKNGRIDFNETLLEKYALIGLNEIECVLLIKLKQILDSNKCASESMIVKELEAQMSLNENEISDKIVKLINSQFIELNEENYSLNLEGVYKRLDSLNDSEEKDIENEENVNDLRKIASFIEKECEHLVTPLELEVIKHWVEVDKYSFSEIKDATLSAVSHKKKGVKYIDAFLNKKKESQKIINSSENSELSELFQRAVYGHKK